MITAYEFFQQVLVGDFDNQRQVDAERAAGKQVHPFAQHVNRIFTHRIEGLPPDLEGCYILEESYYTYPNQPMTIKPHLFYVVPHGDEVARLRPVKMPEHWPLEAIRNDNPALKFHIDELSLIEWFNPADYRMIGETLQVNNPNDLGDGRHFTLTETFTIDRLEVMELWMKDGVQLTPYNDPIIYERIPQNPQ